MSRLLRKERILLLIALAAACGKDAEINAPAGTLAVGAYAPLSYDDTCKLHALGGKVPAPPTCIPHGVTEVLEFASSDPTIADVVAAADVPLDDDAASGYYVFGKGPGQATLTFKGRFDDGSVRQATTSVQVKVPDSIKLRAVCWDGYPVANVMLPAGDEIAFTIEIYAGEEQLVGWLPNAITGDGVALGEKSAGDSERPFVWQSPVTPTSVQLQSAYVSNIIGSLTAFTQSQVTDIRMSVYNEDYRNAFNKPEGADGTASFSVPTSVIVNGQPSCSALPAELHSATPAICSGPNGEMAWGTSWWGGYASARAEGTCTLSASMQGGPVVATQSFPVFFVSNGLGLTGTTDPCTVEGETACMVGHAGAGLCRSGAWVAEPHCPADQVCDQIPGTAAECVPGGTCARCRGLVDGNAGP